VRSHAPNAKLLGFVGAEPNHARAMRREIVGFRRQGAVRAGKQEMLGDQRIECRNVYRELRGAESSFEGYNLRIIAADQDSSEVAQRSSFTTTGDIGDSLT